MVSIVIISHSEKIAQGAKELALEMAKDVRIKVAGGTSDGRIGTDLDKILKAIEEVYSEDGVLILFDLGSALMNGEMALEFMDENKVKRIKILDIALIEGAVTTAVEASLGKSLDEIIEAVDSLRLKKM